MPIFRSDRGVNTMTVTFPDTITTWRIYGLGTAPTGLFGIAKPASLTMFSTIFLEVSLPSSVTSNEQFAVQATVFNHNERVALEDVSESGNSTTAVLIYMVSCKGIRRAEISFI